MENQTKEMQQRRFQFMLPVLVIPFLTLLFWALGGGTGNNVVAQAPITKGIKTELPVVNIKQDPANKMSYYDLANADSLANNELKKNDPYYQGNASTGIADQLNIYGRINQPGINTSSFGGNGFNANEAAIYQRVNDINTALNQPAMQPSVPFNQGMNPYAGQGATKADLDRLEQMMKMMESGERKPDAEMQEVNTMLERIMDIQNPGVAQEKIRAASKKKKEQVFPVSAESRPEPVALLKTEASAHNEASAEGFFSLKPRKSNEEFPSNTIKAVVHGTQTLLSGAELKMRLLKPAFINGVKIPKDNIITGIATLNGERLMVSVEQIQYGDHLFPVSLSVFDLSGLEGIRIEGAMSRDVATQSGAGALQGINLPMLEPSIAAQAASAGIEFTKGLIGKKSKLIPFTVKAGHKILLKDENQRSEVQ
ncbi:conjugative transposon protein TraM [Chitinophaga niabensis]|uniref:Bacteroides conjugative transposon TraM protein n=1 Tax=Chitinophaga niabensis TaxID=536979 RepID=A0A1N6E584_9BACT|nr:conjugative transposon protein TraM [Chitinophaga niabensis]SIN78169.1 Bacteroides conjugative transposon TraM protein [Chitinophaga niabensis]